MNKRKRMKKRGLIAGICLLMMGSVTTFALSSVWTYSFPLNGGEGALGTSVYKHFPGSYSKLTHTYTSNAMVSTRYNVCLQDNIGTSLTDYITVLNGDYTTHAMTYINDMSQCYVRLKGIPASSSVGSYVISGNWDVY